MPKRREMDADTKSHLHNQLIKLGDMMGDGLHLDPGGAWISREYRRVARALGYGPPKFNDNARINERMAERVREVPCGKCNGKLKQSRSGSMRAVCTGCGSRFQLLKKSKAA